MADAEKTPQSESTHYALGGELAGEHDAADLGGRKHMLLRIVIY